MTFCGSVLKLFSALALIAKTNGDEIEDFTFVGEGLCMNNDDGYAADIRDVDECATACDSFIGFQTTCKNVKELCECFCVDGDTLDVVAFPNTGVYCYRKTEPTITTPPTTFFEGQSFTISKPESRFSNEDGVFSIPLNYSQVGKSVSFIQLSLMEKTCTNVTTENVIALNPSTSGKFERGDFTAPQVNVDTTKFSSSILVVGRSKNDAIGVLKFCVRTDGFLEIDGTETSVSFRKDEINLSFDLSSNSFSVESISIKADNVQTSKTNVTTSYNVTAFRCDEDSFDAKKTNTPIQQNELVYICVKPHSGPVFIESFSMGFYQGSSTEKFKAVGIDGYVSSLSYVSTAVKTKKVASRVISTFFNDEGTSFDVRGNAYLAFDSTRIRQLRYLQETDNAGQATFKMNIGLENKKILNDGSESTIETHEILIAIGGLLIVSIGFIIVKKMKK